MTNPKPEEASTTAEVIKSLLPYINATPELLSLLYDMDLMPEQLKEGTRDWGRMGILAAWHRHHFAAKGKL